MILTKIDDIFANETLYAARYNEDGDNELKRLQDLWTNPIEVHKFVKRNGGVLLSRYSIDDLSKMIFKEAEEIDNILTELKNDPTKKLNDFFVPLNDGDSELIPLGKKKGKIKNGLTFLRLYAIKIEDNCYLITGGAIKMTKKMGGNGEDTDRERSRLDIWRADLHKSGVKCKEDFFEFIKKQNGDFGE